METTEKYLEKIITELNSRSDVADLRIDKIGEYGLTDSQIQVLGEYKPENVLIIYGTLGPGKPNHHKVANINGEWKAGVIMSGKLERKGWGAEMGFDGYVPTSDASSTNIDAMVLFSSQLTDYLAQLDEFEGEGYRRILAMFKLSTGQSGIGYIYAIA